MQPTILSKLDADSIFMMLKALKLCTSVLSGLDCSGPGVALPNCRFATEIESQASSCSYVNFFLAQEP